ncbi:MAG: MlaD family protein [Culturomica sp.]|jgi:phospholipid/cholesterol/gamma-HCH transport system substrate-binding protein|nr:MlaD family protein [Culturomica sp.]
MKIKKEVKLAISVIAALIILIFGINFLKARAIFEKNNVFYGIYENVDGLKISSGVVYRGYHVGQITSINFIGERYENILVEFTVGKKLEIPANSVASIQNADLMGTKVITILSGDSPLFAENRDTLQTSTQQGLLGQVNEQLEPLKRKVEATISSLDEVLTSVQSILNSDTQNDIESTFKGLHSTIQNLENTSANLNDLMISERRNISEIVGNIHSVSGNLKNNNENISTVLSNIASITDSLNAAGLAQTVGNLNNLLLKLDSIAAKVNTNGGTLGELVNNYELYYDLTYLSANLEKLLTDFRENPKKFVNLSVFDFSSGSKQQNNYGIIIFESDKPLEISDELYKNNPKLEEIRRNGKFYYMISTHKKLKQAEAELEIVKKNHANAFIVKI